MNLKLKRLVRTGSSEQYALFDLDQLWGGAAGLDEGVPSPLTIGKLDLHYTAEGVYGTLLLWDDATRALEPADRQSLITALLDEVAQPMGVPSEYVVEFFAPTLEYYEVFHNVGADEEDLQAENGAPGTRELVRGQAQGVIESKPRRPAQAPT